MQIFVGLGNPGAKYARNRHNIGFMALDQIAEKNGFSPWKAKFQGQISEGRLGPEKVILLKPDTFMNLSGQSVGEAMRFFKLEQTDITVFHDELDLAPGKCRVKNSGGHAGHNGLRSLHQHIGADYQRVRLGIGHPGHKDAVASYVLHDFAKADQVWLAELLSGIADGAGKLAQADTAGFMNSVALSIQKTKAAPAAKSPGPIQNSGSTNAAKTDIEPPDTKTALQKLIDKFK